MTGTIDFMIHLGNRRIASDPLGKIAVDYGYGQEIIDLLEDEVANNID
ncbi:hypothetical protein ACFL1Z_02690 [Thermodesulfobacteriota bacterium]